MLFFLGQSSQVDRGNVDRAAKFGTTGQFRIVVGITELPHKLEPRTELLEELHHFRCRVDILLDARVADQTVGDPTHVVDNAVRRWRVPCPGLRRRSRYPDTAARQRGGTTEVTGLFDDQ